MEIYKPFQLFSVQESRDIIQSVKGLDQALVWGGGRKVSVRNNSVYWMQLDQQLKARLWDLALPLRSEYPWTWFQEPIQISCYGPGEFYDWHDDVITGRTSRRCLTLTCSLSSAPGAKFETRDSSWVLDPGWGLFFPSNVSHRATAPSEGTRWAFTVWYMQPN